MRTLLASRVSLRAALAMLPVWSAPLLAQVEEDPVTVPVRFALVTGLVGGNGYGSAGFYVNGYGNVYTFWDDPQYVSFPVTANLVPGRTYSLSLYAEDVEGSFELYFKGPTGYRVFVESVERNALIYEESGGSVYVPPTVTIRVDNGEGAGPGESSALRPGRLIWTVGLGGLKNGQPAGVIALRQSNVTALSAADFQASALHYSAPSAEVQTYYGTGPNAGKYQIFANQCLAHVEPLTGGQEGFALKFYSRGDVSSTQSNGLWNIVLDGSSQPVPPYVEYTVQNTTPYSYSTAAKLRITKVNRLNSAGQSAVNTWRTELQQVSGQPSGTYKWQVIDWTTNGIDGSGNLIIGDSWSQWTYTNNGLNEDIQVFTGTSTLASRVYNVYQSFAWGAELVSSTAGYGYSNPLTTQFAYHTTTNTWGDYSRLLYRIEPTGKWERYEYHDSLQVLGQIQMVYEPWLDAPTSPTAGNYTSGFATLFGYAFDADIGIPRPSGITRQIGGADVGRTLINYATVPVTENVVYGGTTYPVTRHLIQATTQSYYNTSQAVTSVARAYREDAGMGLFQLTGGQWVYEVTRGFLPGLPYDATAPDGTKQVWTYTRGNRDSWFWGFQPDGEGAEWWVCQENQGASGLVAGMSTASSTVYGYDGTLVLTFQHAYTSSGWVKVSATRGNFLKNIVTIKTETNAGNVLNYWTTQESTWAGGQLVTTKDAAGVETEFTYDGKGRLKTERVVSIAGQPQDGEQWVIHAYNGADQEVSTTRTFNNTGGDANEDIVTTVAYDYAGRPTQNQVWGQSGWLTTTFTYNYGNYRTTLATHPGGGTTISEVHYDGRPKSVTGTAQAPQYFTYWVDGDGKICTIQSLTPAWNGDGWTAGRTDWLGRSVWTSGPTQGGSGYYNATVEYNSAGQMAARYLYNASWQLNLAPTRYAYGSMGELLREGLDVNENTSLDDTGVDRVTLRSYNFVWADSAWWREVTTKTLTNPNNASDGVTSIVRERLTGRTGTLQAETRAIDANGQTTTSKTIVDRANKTVTVETTVPGSTITAKKITKNGFPAQTISAENVTTTFTYDVYGRPIKTQGREDVLEEKVYYPKSGLVKHVRNKLMTPAVIGSEWQTFTYDSAGRPATHQTNNLGVWKTVRYEYDAAGRLIHQWGDAANPVEYVYNTYGWRTTMRLYRNGSNWNASTWSAAVAGTTADTTTWTYHGPTGLVTAKTDPANRTVSFTYNDRHQVVTRTWARGVVTTYSYYNNAGYRTGELSRKDYSDGTNSVEYLHTGWNGEYTRTGQVRRTVDATAYTEFFYRPHDSQLKAERLDWGFYGVGGAGGRELYRTYDSLGRPAGHQVGWEDSAHAGNAPTTFEYETVYGYDGTTGRVNYVVGHRPYIVWRDFRYDYRANSNLVSTVWGNGFGFRRDIYHQSWRNLIDDVITSWSGAAKARFTYDYDWVEQRTRQRTQKELALRLGYSDADTAGIHDNYLFTARGEVDYTAAAVAAWNGSQWVDGAAIPDRYRDWTYDNVGNRTREVHTAEQLLYGFTGGTATGADNLNQYWRISRCDFTTPTPQELSFTSPVYDLDGNLTDDGVWIYEWDAENRLRTAQKKDYTKRLELTYDYQGRRVRKVVKNGDVNAAVASDRRYIYDGWNIVGELDGLQGGSVYTLTRTFTWGLDITGTIHGGGGVGGLLMTATSSAHQMPVYDGNGNVRGLLDGSTGNMVAAYAYSAFGEILQAVNPYGGTYAEDNPIRFASKWYDSETQLYDYNHRVYSPSLGRFLSRDPIGENGGLNLYAYCGNDPIGHWDYLGQSWLSKLHKKLKKVLFKTLALGLPNRRSVYRHLVRFDEKTEPYAKIIGAAVASYFTGGAASGWMQGALAGLGKAGVGAAVRTVAALAAKSIVASATNSAILGTKFDTATVLRAGLASGISEYAIGRLPAAMKLDKKSFFTVFGSTQTAKDAGYGIVLRGVIKGTASEITGKGFEEGFRGSIIGDFQALTGATFKELALEMPVEIENPYRKFGKSFVTQLGSRFSGAALKGESLALEDLGAASFSTAWNDTFALKYDESPWSEPLRNMVIFAEQIAVATGAAMVSGKDFGDGFDSAARAGLKRVSEGYAKSAWPEEELKSMGKAWYEAAFP